MTHQDLVERAQRWLKNSAKCMWVLAERKAGYVYDETADAIGWDRYGHSILIECKASMADFNKDKFKDFRLHPAEGMGRLRYYMCPSELEEAVRPKLPEKWGLLIVCGKSQRIFAVKPAEPQPRNTDVEISLVLHRSPAALPVFDAAELEDKVARERGETMAITVIGAKKEGNYLYVTLQAPSQEEAVSPEARRIAYEERDRHGFSTAGIEAFGGTMPVDLTNKDEEGALGKPLSVADLKTMTQDDHRQRIGYRAVYRLMRGI